MRITRRVRVLFCVGILVLVAGIAKWAIYGTAPDNSTKLPSPGGRYVAIMDLWDAGLNDDVCIRIRPAHSVLPSDVLASGGEITGAAWIALCGSKVPRRI
jgi:hypothetical protein